VGYSYDEEEAEEEMTCCIRGCKNKGRTMTFHNPFTKELSNHDICDKHRDNPRGYNFIYENGEAALG
jgi:hypothetical protein